MPNSRWLANFLEYLISIFIKIESFFLPIIIYILPFLAMIVVSFMVSLTFVESGFLDKSNIYYLVFAIEFIYLFILLVSSYSFLNFIKSKNQQTKFYIFLFLLINFLYLLSMVFIIVFMDNKNSVSNQITTVKILITLLFYINPQMFFISTILENFYYKNLKTTVIIRVTLDKLKTLSNKSGIYKIINIKSGKVYIGRTKELKNRLLKHFYDLKRDKHSNKFLQKDFNDGYIFEIEILEQFDKYDYFETVFLEHAYIDKFKSRDDKYGYNLLP